MKVGESRGPREVRGRKLATGEKATGQSVGPVADDVRLTGISEAELTPNVNAALTSLLKEVYELRQNLNAARRRISELEEIANRDSLVDALNRRAFVRALNQTLATVDRYGVPASLVFIDVNNLKKLNDEFGHALGDAALAHVAELIIQNTRRTDVFGRIGGDEFALILNHLEHEVAEVKSENLALTIQEEPLMWNDQKFLISVSMGVVSLDASSSAIEALTAADHAMYRSKRDRRT